MGIFLEINITLGMSEDGGDVFNFEFMEDVVEVGKLGIKREFEEEIFFVDELDLTGFDKIGDIGVDVNLVAGMEGDIDSLFFGGSLEFATSLVFGFIIGAIVAVGNEMGGANKVGETKGRKIFKDFDAFGETFTAIIESRENMEMGVNHFDSIYYTYLFCLIQ